MNGQNYKEEKEKITRERDMIIELAMAEHDRDVQSAEQRRDRSYDKSQNLHYSIMDPLTAKMVKKMQDFDPDTDPENWPSNTESKKADLIVKQSLKTLSDSREHASSYCDDEIEAAAFKYALAVTKTQYTHDTKQLALRDNTS
jgi:hypothetical protein